MTTPAADGFDITSLVQTSGPIDLSAPYSLSTLHDKTILITGGASGIGAALARHWASHGAHIIVGDIGTAAGTELISELRCLRGSLGQQHHHHHFVRCDVTVWEDQLAMFREAVRLSPTGGVDAVVANAGIYEKKSTITGLGFEDPAGLDGEGPAPPPGLEVLKTNLIGLAYTVHLALYWLPRNEREGDKRKWDRHLLLMGSIAGIMPLPGFPEYCAAKHGVTGLFRALAGTTSSRQGVRVNLLLPYFADTPLLPWQGMMFLAGAGWVEVGDVVEAGTRLMADEGIRGRALAVTAPVDVAGEGQVRGMREAVWEVMAHDYERTEAFVWRYVRLMNTLMRIRGWSGFLRDCVRFAWFRRSEENKRDEERKRV